MASPDGIKGCETRQSRRQGRRYRPAGRDVYLVCYPRSGSTWLRGMVAEAMFGTSGRTLEELDGYCPDIHANTPASQVQPAAVHMVKSHWPRSPRHQADRYQRIVYLLRDPRDVVLSHFRYLTGLGRYGGNFDEFLTDWLCGRVYPCSWAEHVISWLGPAGAGSEFSMLTLRYEDLSADPVGQLARLLSFVGVECSDERLKEVVELCSADRMRVKERKGMRPDLRVEALEFIGPARCGRWREELTEAQLERIYSLAGTAMKITGYD
ncbi:MAG: sulfotransferase domain-containing protein [Phycisphaerae bacterium]